MSLPDIEKLIERSIYHCLREKTVAEGYSPDIMDYDVDNPDITIATQESDRYMQDLADLAEDKGFAIELFNFSNNQARGTKKSPRIVVETQAFLPGNLGLDTTPQYVKQPNGSYVPEYQSNSVTSDFFFNIHLVASSVEQIRILNGIMNLCLPRRGYMKWMMEPGLRKYQNLFVRYISHQPFDYLAEGILERVYRYEIPDVHDLDPVALANVPPIKIIDLDIKGKGISGNLNIQ